MIEIVRLGAGHLALATEFFRTIDIPRIRDHFHPHEFTEREAQVRCAYSGKDEYFLLLDGGRAAGYGMLRGWDQGYEAPSLGICIRPDSQGRGLGRHLMDHLILVARLRGARRIILKVNRTNPAAIALYRGLGFEMTGLDADYLRGTLSFPGS